MAVTEVDYANRRLRIRRLAELLSYAVRRAQFELFMSQVQPKPDHRILDVGVTPDNDLLEANFLEKLYPYPGQITAASTQDASNLETAFPGLSFVRLTSERLPFADEEFDVVFSSAVIEHVGDRQRQAQFLAELHRVGRSVFVTTPNRWFPIELHTALPLVHWLPQPAHQRFLRLFGQHQWASTDNLNLLSARELISLFPGGITPRLHRQRLLGLCSNLAAWSSRNEMSV